MDETLKKALIEMFSRVGLDFTWERIKAYEKSYPMWSKSVGIASRHDWYFSKSWTQAEEDEFTEWLKKLFYNDKVFKVYPAAARRKIVEREVQHFLLNWGWKHDV